MPTVNHGRHAPERRKRCVLHPQRRTHVSRRVVFELQHLPAIVDCIAKVHLRHADARLRLQRPTVVDLQLPTELMHQAQAVAVDALVEAVHRRDSRIVVLVHEGRARVRTRRVAPLAVRAEHGAVESHVRFSGRQRTRGRTGRPVIAPCEAGETTDAHFALLVGVHGAVGADVKPLTSPL
jgi:hypothetical protein